jgi:uncharacterized membrane protein YphA (DoxX/SURF4 family)
LPTATAYATVAIEAVGGAMLILGLGTRLWGALATLQMIGTSLVVKRDVGLIAAAGQGAGMELDLLILAGALAVVLIGPGPFSLDHLIGIDRAGPASRLGPTDPAPVASDNRG